MVREESIETFARKEVKAVGGLCIKLNPFGFVGIPDRLFLLPGGRLRFVEMKKPRNYKIARLQRWWHDKLIALGFDHDYAFTRDDVRRVIEEMTQ